MTRKIAIASLALLLLAAPALPFWGAFFAGIGKAVGKALGLPQGGLGLNGLMPVTVKAAQPVIDEAQKRLAELELNNLIASDTLEHYMGVAGTLSSIGGFGRFRAQATNWLRSTAADRYGTSGPWIRAVNGDAVGSSVVSAYGRAAASVPNWSAALPTLPQSLRDGVLREHATLELADAASVRSMAVLGEGRRLAPQRRQANSQLEQAVLDPSAPSQALPALLGKVSVAQVRQIREIEQTNQLLDALLETELADRKRDRDRLARSMQAAAEYRALADSQPVPLWRMP